MADTLYVNPVWPDKISWVHGIAYANLDAKLLGHHFTEIVLCMAELRPLLRHDYTLDDVLGSIRNTPESRRAHRARLLRRGHVLLPKGRIVSTPPRLGLDDAIAACLTAFIFFVLICARCP
jgi:hypothetical protein